MANLRHMFMRTLGVARSMHARTQALLLDDSEKVGSMSLLAHMAPISAALLLPLTIFYEPSSAAEAYQLVAASGGFTVLLVSNCLLAFFVNWTNFLVTKHCGALTLQVLGNAKGVVAAVISVFIFHNPVTVLGWLGYGITMAGVVAYSESRKRSGKAAQAADAAAVKQRLLDAASPRSPASYHGEVTQRGSGGAATAAQAPERQPLGASRDEEHLR
jgi:Triose-phosphate Transporter family